MKKTTLALILLVSLIFSCSEKEETYEKDSFITLIFKNHQISDTTFFGKNKYAIDNNQVYYKYHNDFIGKTLNIKKSIDTIRINSSKPIYFYHKYFIKDFCVNAYYFYPNDTLVFEYEGKVPFVTSSKKHNYNHGSFFNIKDTLDFNDFIYFDKFKRFKNFIERENDVIKRNKRDSQQFAFLDSLFNKNQIDKKNYELSKSYFEMKEEIATKSPLQILKKPYDLGNDTYASIVNNAFEEFLMPKFKDIDNGRVTDIREQFQNAVNLKNINKENREYLMFTTLENIALRGKKEVFLNCYATYVRESQNSNAVNHFKIKFPTFFKTKEINIDDVVLFNEVNQKISLSQIIAQNKGKVIYIDFWASWCAPCRALFPSSKALQGEYKDKDVKFIYISLDDDKEKWSTASRVEGLTNFENSFLGLNFSATSLFQELELSTIPRYLIYNKNGKLIDSNAPHPDSREIRNHFNNYLK